MILAQVPTQRPPLQIPHVEYSAMLPFLIMIGGALVLLTGASLVRKRPPQGVYALFTVAVGGASMIATWNRWLHVRHHGPYQVVARSLVVDGYSLFFLITIGVAVILGALVADGYLAREGLEGPEFHVLMMLSASGGMVMAMANDLIVLFLGLEILSIALYVLAGFHRSHEASREAAMKYFVLGAFSSALFLYGIALVYGSTGSTNLPEIATYLAQNVTTSNGVFLAGIVLLLVGLAFKVSAVPFHTWTPDVYQGAPTPATAFMAAAAKAAGFAGLLRIFFSTFRVASVDWRPVVWGLAVLTLLVGSVLAIVQNDIKRMLAYSSISHAGYVLIGLQAASKSGIAGSLFYLLAYTFMVIGSFAVVTIVGRHGDENHALDAYRGLRYRRPLMAFAFTVFLFAQAGIPFTTGFLAKFYVIRAAVQSHSWALALIGMLSAVIAAFFYLRVVTLMYTAPGDDEAPAPTIHVPASAAIVLTLAAAFTIVFGILPSAMIHFAEKATLLF